MLTTLRAIIVLFIGIVPSPMNSGLLLSSSVHNGAGVGAVNVLDHVGLMRTRLAGPLPRAVAAERDGSS